MPVKPMNPSPLLIQSLQRAGVHFFDVTKNRQAAKPSSIGTPLVSYAELELRILRDHLSREGTHSECVLCTKEDEAATKELKEALLARKDDAPW